MHYATPLLSLALVLATGSQGITAPKPVETQREKEAALIQLVDKRFTHWDHNHDGILEIDEVDREIENRSVADARRPLSFVFADISCPKTISPACRERSCWRCSGIVPLKKRSR